MAEKHDSAGKRALPVEMSTSRIRTRIAQVLWLVCAVCALILAGGALCIALGANEGNALYEFFVDTGDRLDFGVLSRENGLFDFVGKNSDTKDALTNWGIAAIVWLVIGRLLDRVVRP